SASSRYVEHLRVCGHSSELPEQCDRGQPQCVQAVLESCVPGHIHIALLVFLRHFSAVFAPYFVHPLQTLKSLRLQVACDPATERHASPSPNAALPPDCSWLD